MPIIDFTTTHSLAAALNLSHMNNEDEAYFHLSNDCDGAVCCACAEYWTYDVQYIGSDRYIVLVTDEDGYTIGTI
jgi:hypothetical protein